MRHDSLHLTDQDVIGAATVEVPPSKLRYSLCSVRLNSVSAERCGPHNSIGRRDVVSNSWLMNKALDTNTLATKNEVVLLSRHVELCHRGFQQCFGGFATRVICV